MAAEVHNPLRSLAGYHLRRASAAAMDELSRELAGLDLRPTEASVLLLVGANPMIKPVEVGRELGIQRANMTPLVAALERRGLLAREAVDGRSQGLTLTEDGRVACEAAHSLMELHDRRLLSRLDASGMAVAPALLARLWAGDPDT
jgi:DNA-binding MarR family transcriptional regulator